MDMFLNIKQSSYTSILVHHFLFPRFHQVSHQEDEPPILLPLSLGLLNQPLKRQIEDLRLPINHSFVGFHLKSKRMLMFLIFHLFLPCIIYFSTRLVIPNQIFHTSASLHTCKESKRPSHLPIHR